MDWFRSTSGISILSIFSISLHPAIMILFLFPFLFPFLWTLFVFLGILLNLFSGDIN